MRGVRASGMITVMYAEVTRKGFSRRGGKLERMENIPLRPSMGPATPGIIR